MKKYSVFSLMLTTCLIVATVMAFLSPAVAKATGETRIVEVGKESPILDYAKEGLALIDAANAVMVNTDTLYVYENGVRTEKTKSEVDALIADTEGKKVIKNEYGLVIISDQKLTLTNQQIASLQNYMVYTRPKAADLKSLFGSGTTSEHPRIVLDQAKFDKIIADSQTNELMKEWAAEVIKAAELALTRSHVKYERPDGTRMTSCRTILDGALNLSMAYKLTGEEKYKDFLWEDLEKAAGFIDWNHDKHYLDTGEFAAGFAIAYDWLYHDWTEDQREILEEAIYEKALCYQHEYLCGVRKAGMATYITSETNRSAVCNGGIGLAALAVFDVYTEKCADILEKTYHVMETMLMNQFAPSGASTEGPAYWEYMMRFLSKFMASTEQVFGTDFNIYETPGFETTGEYYLNIDGMTGANNFHDATESTPLYAGYLFWISNALDQPGLTEALLLKMDQMELSGDIYSLLYYDSDIKMDSDVNMPLDVYYNGLELVSMRSSWLNRAGIFASIHSGVTGVSHAHIDSGTFVVDIGGQRFAGDIGKEDYNLAATGGSRYYYYRMRPEGHNVFVINPDTSGKDIGQRLNAAEVISEFVSKDRGAYTIVSLDSCYADHAKSATRGMMLGDDRNSVLIRDEIRGMKKDENTVYWFMQMQGVEVEIAADGKSAVLSKGGVDVNLQVLSDNAIDYEIKVMDTKEMYPLPGLADWAKQTVNTGWSRLAIIFKAGKDLNINVKMAQADDAKGDTPIKDVSLEDWEIEDGILAETPSLNSITIGDEKLPGFSGSLTFYNYELPYRTTECPEVTVTGGENCDIEIKTPKTLPGYLKVTVTSKKDSALQTTYKVMLTVAGEISIEASDFQDGNPPKNCLDGDLSTRWAVEGDSWGIFRFAEPKRLNSIWLASWLASERALIFEIEVSEDGENFTQVWSGTTTMVSAGQPDRLEEFKIPEGTYKAVKINLYGAEYPDGREYAWNSVLDVKFTEISSEEDSAGGTVETDPDGETSSAGDETEGSDVDVDQPGGKNNGTVILIAVVAVVIVAVAIVLRKNGGVSKR